MLWRKKKKLLRNANGHIIRCSKCPCKTTPPLPPSCCFFGHSYAAVNFYVSLPVDGIAVGCMPANTVSTLTGTFRYGYLQNPQPGPPSWIGGGTGFFFSSGLAGLCTYDQPETVGTGCIQFRSVGACTPPANPFEDFHDPRFVLVWQISVDGGATWTISQAIDTGTYDGENQATCDISAGCYSLTFEASGAPPGLYVSKSSIASGIPVPDLAHSVVPLSVTFSFTLTLAGVPTLYSAPLQFSPGAAAGGCYEWAAFSLDCNGDGYTVYLFRFSSDWIIKVSMNGMGAGVFLTVYSGTSYPTSGIKAAWMSNCDDTNPGVGGTVPWSLS